MICLFLLKNLTLIKNKIWFELNGGKDVVPHIDVPKLAEQNDEKITPSLSLLISSINDLHLCDETSADIYFQVPNHFKNKLSKLVELF